MLLLENVCEKQLQYSGEKSPLSSLPSALLKMTNISLGLHPCAAAESSCPPVHRCWDHECVAVCSCFCAAVMSKKEKSECKTLHEEMEVSVTGQECRWGFGHTKDVGFFSFA